MDTPAFRSLDRLTLLTTASLGSCAFGNLLLPLLSGDDENLLVAFATLGLGSSVVVAVVGSVVGFLMWMHRAASNLRALHPEAAFEFTPGWAVGWWFVPLANLVKPGQAMAEIARASHVGATSGAQTAASWLGIAAPMVAMWWALWVVMSIFSRVTARIDGNTAVTIIDAGLTITTAIAAILVIRGITEDQNVAAARLERVRFADGIAHVVS